MQGSVYLKRSQLQPICHAEIRRRKRRLSYNRLSLWQDLGEAARDGRKAGGWQRWLDGWMRQARDFKEMTWEQVQRKKVRVSSLFVSNCTCRGMHEGEKSVLQDGDNRLRSADRPHPLPPPTPYLCSFSSTLFFCAHSHSLMVLSIYLSSSVSMGAASQRSLEVGGKKEAKPGVQQGHDGP